MFTFIESSIFSRELANYLDDDEYGDLQQHLINYPETGDIIPGSGGFVSSDGSAGAWANGEEFALFITL